MLYPYSFLEEKFISCFACQGTSCPSAHGAALIDQEDKWEISSQQCQHSIWSCTSCFWNACQTETRIRLAVRKIKPNKNQQANRKFHCQDSWDLTTKPELSIWNITQQLCEYSKQSVIGLHALTCFIRRTLMSLLQSFQRKKKYRKGEIR